MDVDDEDNEEEEDGPEDAHRGHGRFMPYLCSVVHVLTANQESSDSGDEGNIETC